MKKSWIYGLSIFVAVVVLVFVCLFPFFWMTSSAFKPLSELYTTPPTWIPRDFSLVNFVNVITESNIPRYFINSTIISVGATGLALIIAVFASYGFARFNFKGKGAAQAFILVGQLLPTAASSSCRCSSRCACSIW